MPMLKPITSKLFRRQHLKKVYEKTEQLMYDIVRDNLFLICYQAVMIFLCSGQNLMKTQKKR